MRVRRTFSSLFISAAMACAGGFGCTTPPLERALEGDASRAWNCLPRSVAVLVEIDGNPEALYGTREQWQEDVQRVLAALGACAHLVPAEKIDDADLRVLVRISRTRTTVSDVLGTGALLDFLAWSTVPLVSLWIPDVNVQPALQVSVERSLRSPEEPDKPEVLAALSADPDPIATNYLVRRPLLSWQTLGALFVPPFVFKGTDPEHLEAELGAWVREATAVKIAGIVRSSHPRNGELLEGLSLRSGAESRCSLTFRPSSGLRRIVVAVADAEVASRTMTAGGAGVDPGREVELPIDLEGVEGAPTHLSVLATGNRAGWSHRYTLCLPRAGRDQ